MYQAQSLYWTLFTFVVRQHSQFQAQTICLNLDKIYNLMDNVKARLPVRNLDSSQQSDYSISER